jgi:hypothetical protein
MLLILLPLVLIQSWRSVISDSVLPCILNFGAMSQLVSFTLKTVVLYCAVVLDL